METHRRTSFQLTPARKGSDRNRILPKNKRFQRRKLTRRRSNRSKASSFTSVISDAGSVSSQLRFIPTVVFQDDIEQEDWETEALEKILSSPIPTPLPQTNDSDYDTDLENQEPAAEEYDPTGKKVYLAGCKKHGVVPSSTVLKALEGECMKLNSLGLSPDDMLAVCIPLLTNTTVTTLDLSDNRIGAAGTAYIAAMLKENIYISNLDLSNNHLGTKGAQNLAEIMEINGSLRVLNISGNGFGDQEAGYIAGIFETGRVKKLNLSHNNFNEEAGKILGPAIAENDLIEELDLSWNQFRLKGARALAEGIKENVGIKTLDLSWNGFSNDGCVYLSKALQENRVVQTLDLSSNRITLEGVQHLCKGLLKNETLRKLKLSTNSIGTAGARVLLQMIKKHVTSHLNCLEILGTRIDPTIEDLIQQIKYKKPRFDVKHGGLVRFSDPYSKVVRPRDAWLGDPLTLLLRYMSERNMRLMDLFSQFDTDSSWTLSIAEFKKGVKQAHIPLSELQLEQLVSRLDKDKDGEIDFKEMLSGHKKHRDRERRLRVDNLELDKIRSSPASLAGSRPSSGSRRGSRAISPVRLPRSSVSSPRSGRLPSLVPMSTRLGESPPLLIGPSPETRDDSPLDDTKRRRESTFPEVRLNSPENKQKQLIHKLERLKTN